jgi:hypothetical protein
LPLHAGPLRLAVVQLPRLEPVRALHSVQRRLVRVQALERQPVRRNSSRFGPLVPLQRHCCHRTAHHDELRCVHRDFRHGYLDRDGVNRARHGADDHHDLAAASLLSMSPNSHPLLRLQRLHSTATRLRALRWRRWRHAVRARHDHRVHGVGHAQSARYVRRDQHVVRAARGLLLARVVVSRWLRRSLHR